jgi:hypothetical protein
MRVPNGIPLGSPLFLAVHTVNYVTTLKAKRLGLEQWTWDAGTYTWCNTSAVCNGTAVVEGKCCDSQGDWFPQQGDYMPKASRFPEHGFNRMQLAIGDAVGTKSVLGMVAQL